MRGLISCYSTTGNTRLVGDRIAEVLSAEGVATVVQNPVSEPIMTQLEDVDIVGFGTPTMAWKPSWGFYACLGLLPTQTKRIPAFVFCTSAGLPVNTLSIMADMLSKKNFTVLDGIHIVGENNWPVARQFGEAAKGEIGRPDASDLEAVVPFAKGLAQRLQKGNFTPKVFEFLNSPLHFIGQRTGAMQLRTVMGKKRVDRNKCTQCAACAGACAVRAISLNPYPVFSNRCMGCWACYNTCPTEAITTSVTGDRGRFKGPPLMAP